MTIEQANIHDNEVLTTITQKSKAYWGYTEEQMKAWSELLTITQEYIDTKSVYKLVIDNNIVGYYSFFNEDGNTVRLDNLFILPEFIGKGLGGALMTDFLFRMQNTDAKKVILDAEPNAEAFYAKLGFVKTGQIATSIKDRYLPTMELKLMIE